MFSIRNSYKSDKRFDPARFMDFNNGYDILDSVLISKIKDLPIYGTYVIRKEPNRPDLLSYNIYKDTQYWWLLMIYNDMASPEDLVLGKEIKFFNTNNLENLYFTLSIS